MADEIFEKAVQIIAEKAETDATDITLDTRLETLEIQSLELAEIVFDLEDEFDIEIEMDAANAWDKLKTVGDVCNAVRELKAA